MISWLKTVKFDYLQRRSNIRNSKDSIVYIIFSTKTHLTYVGETKSFTNRIKTELRNAFRSGMRTYDYKQCQYFEKRMGQIGFETWNYAILENLGHLRINEKNIRLRYESAYIQKIQPSLNIKGLKRNTQIIQAKREKQRPRKIRRNKSLPYEIGPQKLEVLGYEIKDLTSQEIYQGSLVDLFIKKFKFGHIYSIERKEEGGSKRTGTS